MNNDQFKAAKYYPESDFGKLPSINGTTISPFFPRLAQLIFALVLIFIGILFLPWIQTSSGVGQITALHPEDRVQQVISPVTGRVQKWYVRDGSKVNVGDKLAEIVDIDPEYSQRLTTEVTAMHERLIAAQEATRLAMSNYKRQQRLYQAGLTSKREWEVAEINYQKTIADEQYYKSQLLKVQTAQSRQTSQLIRAERAGTVVNTLASSSSKIVKSGDVLATFLPDTNQIAVEIFISGNDVPLVSVGRKVRLVFDGWPSIQFSGWPSVSIGTFGGVVKVVDFAASSNGLFRVLIEPDPSDHPWPAKNFLRMGANAQGYIQLNQVLLGYEIWRQLNGFPIAVNNKNNTITLSAPAGQLTGNDKKKSDEDGYGKDSKD
jgi:multidrug efflux pump subunit AcrA (membrane-fusion protein)